MLQEIQGIIEQGFTGKNVIVLGDLMLDRYLTGKVNRVSPEAPVPVLKLQQEKYTLGGAGNVALNLKGLDISVFLIGLIGEDPEGKVVHDILAKRNLSSNYILTSAGKPTITKTRIVGESQQIVRVDKEDTEVISRDIEARIIKNFQAVIDDNEIDAVILSDYAKGTVTKRICRHIIEESKRRKIFVLVDPKGNDFMKYRNATILMPNEHELARACNRTLNSEKELQEAAETLYEDLNINYLVVTRGEKGISLIAKSSNHTIPTRAREVYDVSGAGDTVIALVTAGLAIDISIKKSLELANLAAGYVVSKFGTHPISYAELNEAMHHHLFNDRKLVDEVTIENCLEYWRSNQQKIVFTNGCFDILHAGHIHLLKKAKEEGDKLIVAINTDPSVRRLKGDRRPINTLEDRVQLLEAISYIDGIIPFPDLTPLRLIKQIKPDVLVKGADYEEDDIVGAREVRAAGGKIVRIPLVEDKSTSRLIRQVSTINE